MHYEISCGIIPVFKNKNKEYEFLLVQHHAGHWGFPKGHQELNENYFETAKRELFEETGLKIKKVISTTPITESYQFHKKNCLIQKKVHYFLAVVDSQDVIIQHDEIQDFFWGPEKNILKKITFNESKHSLQEVLNMLE